MLKKVLIGFLIFFVLLIGAVVAIPFVFKDQINAKIKEQINKELKANVDYTSYDLSIIKSFPDLYFTLNDLTVVGRNDFEGDTLANIKQIGFGLDLMKLVKKEGLEMKTIHIEKPQILAYSMVTSTGDTIANYDILPTSKEKEEDTTSLIDINVNEFTLSEGKLFYKDFVAQNEILINNLNLTAKADYIKDVADIETKLTIDELSFLSGTTQYLNKAKIDAFMDVEADLPNNTYTLKDNEIAINALKLYANGNVSLPDENTTSVDLKFSADKSNFKELLSLIPATYLKDYQNLKADGNFTFNGFAKGNITETETPAFDLNLGIENGKIQYPDLPSAIENINLSANVSNKTSNLDNTNVNVPNAKFSVVGQPIQMRLNAQHVLADPYVDLAVKGSLPLEKIPDFYPLEDVKTIKGNVDTDITFKGLLSAVEQEKYEEVDFTGLLDIKGLQYEAKDLPSAVNADAIHLNFTPKYADFTAKNTVLGSSDFNITGKLENIINYVLSDGMLTAKLDIVSNKINVDELLGSNTEETTETTGTEESGATKVPANLDVIASLKANQIDYDNIEMKNVNGSLLMKDEKLTLSNLNANLMGGTAKISGAYDTKNTNKPKLDLDWDINNFDIQQTFNHFNSVKAIAPLSKFLTGKFSTNMDLNTVLNEDMSLDLTALSGLGKITIPYATFVDMPLMNQISDVTKVSFLKNPELKNAWTVLKFREGRVDVEPFDVKMQDILMNIQGSNGFDQSIDYAIALTVPSDKFGGAATMANQFLAKQNIPLLNLSVPKSLTFHLGVTGDVTKPKVTIKKVTAEDGDKALQDQIKESIQNEIDKAKEQAKEQAQKELDKAKEQAQQEVDKAKEQVKENVQNEVDKAKENVKDRINKGLGGFGW